MFGNVFWLSIFPMSQENILLTGSNAYFPWLAVRLQFSTDFGIGISNLTASN